MVKNTEKPLNRLCRERDVGWAELLNAQISKAGRAKVTGAAAEQA